MAEKFFKIPNTKQEFNVSQDFVYCRSSGAPAQILEEECAQINDIESLKTELLKRFS